MSPTDTALVACLVPLAGAALTALAGRSPALRAVAALLPALITAGLVATLVPHQGVSASVIVCELAPGLPLAFHVEPLGVVFALVASTLWAVTALYSLAYLHANHERNQTRFLACVALAIACALGAAFSANLLTLFICYELLSLSTVPLVTHHGTPEAVRAGRTYLGILMGTSVGLLLAAIIAIATLTGNDLAFRPGGVLQGQDATTVGLLFALAVYGIGKAALMPVHRWLPAAMVAPAPVSALLHAVAVVKCGVFAVLKVTIYTFGPTTLAVAGGADWLVWVSSFSLVAASAIAAFQGNLKRRLAYSTVSHLGYIVLAAGLAAQGGAAARLAVAAGTLHILAHACAKITLFFAAGNVYTAHHITEVSQLDGIGRRMPVTFGAFALAAVSLIGLPPTVGFLSKWSLLQAAWSADAGVAVVALVLSTLISSIYLLEIVHRAFFRAPADPHALHGGEAPWPMRLAIVGTALAGVALFLVPGLPGGLAARVAEVLP